MTVTNVNYNDPPLQGRTDTLTDDQTIMLKEMWRKLFLLFEQKGEPWELHDTGIKCNKTTSKNSKSHQKQNAEEEDPQNTKGRTKHQIMLQEFLDAEDHGFETNLFIGKTSNPLWTILPMEEAIPLIPGHLLHLTFWNMISADNPDSVVLRFLRARKWDLDASYAMLVNTLRWRIYIRVDDVCALGETGMVKALDKLKPGLGEQFYSNIHCNKTVIGGPDKAGRAICYVNPRFHKKEDQEFEVVKLLTVYVMENSRMIVHQPIETACLVFNMEGFTLANMDFDFCKFLLFCFESYYPETLGSCILHKVPWVFSTVWAMVSPLIDPVVASKVFFTKNIKELSEFIDIDIIPPFLTGKETIKVDLDEERPPPPPEGSLERPDVPQVSYYNTMIEEFEKHTVRWMNDPLLKASDPDRKQHALMYRHTTINAELFLRGRTSYHEIGLAGIENGRFILKFMGNAPALDVTDSI